MSPVASYSDVITSYSIHYTKLYDLALAHPAGNSAPLPKQRSLALAVERACRYQALKEEAKHHALRELAVIRRLLVALSYNFV